MIIDIAIAVILILCVFIGDRKGFLKSFISTFGWVISMGIAYLLRSPFSEYLDEHTSMRDDITVKITEYIKARIQMAATGTTAEQGGVASLLRTAADKAIQTSAAKAAEPIADVIFSLLAFVLLIIVIKIIIYIIERIVNIFIQSSNPVNSLNSILGMIFALLQGCILSSVVLIVLFIIAVIGDFEGLLDQLGSSFVCQTLLNMGILPDVFTDFSVADVLQQL
jgi:hypothetical protein